ncbi:MAG: hypothetical protein K1X74_17545 [Pirellulales bacterium]|nr:hypothetical protein [Pirellulales bacterium]
MNQLDTWLQRAAELVRNAQEIVVFTGAGMSAESGIPTFRDAGGLWEEFPPEQFATFAGLLRTASTRPREFVRFLATALAPIAAAEPHAGYRALVQLEKHSSVTIVTQNIDGLHQEAGSWQVHEIHGSLLEITTRKGQFVKRLTRKELRGIVAALQTALDSSLALPRSLLALRKLIGANVRGIYRPNVVLFGEAMAEPAWSHALAAVRECDLLLIVGTSGEVWPAASLPQEARAHGAPIITIDPDAARGDVVLRGTAATILPRLLSLAGV